MKKQVLLIFLFYIYIGVQHSFAQGFLNKDSLYSKILDKHVPYYIYIMDTSTRKVPPPRTLYLLHGLHGHETDWVNNGKIVQTIDSLYVLNEIKNWAIIMPDAGNSYYVNKYDNSFNYEDMFFKELIPTISSKYNLATNLDQVAIAGLSMGGFGAVSYCLRHPNTFNTCAAISGALRTEDQYNSLNNDYFRSYFEPVFGQNPDSLVKASQYWKSVNPLHLINNTPIEYIRQINWYLDCGNQDPFALGNSLFHTFLLQNNIAHEFHLRTGKHDWDYWKKNIIPAIIYIDSKMN